MQSVSSRIWTRVAVFISNDDNNYTTGTSILSMLLYVSGGVLVSVDPNSLGRQHQNLDYIVY